MLKEGSEQVWASVFRQQCVSDFLGQVVNIPGDEVGHLAICGMPPTLLDAVQFRRIRGPKLHGYPCAIEVTEQAGCCLVPAAAVPDEEQRASDTIDVEFSCKAESPLGQKAYVSATTAQARRPRDPPRTAA